MLMRSEITIIVVLLPESQLSHALSHERQQAPAEFLLASYKGLHHSQSLVVETHFHLQHCGFTQYS